MSCPTARLENQADGCALSEARLNSLLSSISVIIRHEQTFAWLLIGTISYEDCLCVILRHHCKEISKDRKFNVD